MPLEYGKLQHLYNKCRTERAGLMNNHRTMKDELRCAREDTQKVIRAIDKAIKTSPFPEIRWQIFINEVIKHAAEEKWI